MYVASFIALFEFHQINLMKENTLENLSNVTVYVVVYRDSLVPLGFRQLQLLDVTTWG